MERNDVEVDGSRLRQQCSAPARPRLTIHITLTTNQDRLRSAAICGGPAVYEVDLKPGPIPAFGAPKVLLQAQGMNMGGSGTVWGWAITPDGKRVLARSFASVATNALEDIEVVLNWPALIK